MFGFLGVVSEIGATFNDRYVVTARFDFEPNLSARVRRNLAPRELFELGDEALALGFRHRHDNDPLSPPNDIVSMKTKKGLSSLSWSPKNRATTDERGQPPRRCPKVREDSPNEILCGNGRAQQV
ncbi:MAG TPA: hypothetical protein VGM51_14265, partial [Armatimonadota bacterium]